MRTQQPIDEQIADIAEFMDAVKYASIHDPLFGRTVSRGIGTSGERNARNWLYSLQSEAFRSPQHTTRHIGLLKAAAIVAAQPERASADAPASLGASLRDAYRSIGGSYPNPVKRDRLVASVIGLPARDVNAAAELTAHILGRATSNYNHHSLGLALAWWKGNLSSPSIEHKRSHHFRDFFALPSKKEKVS